MRKPEWALIQYAAAGTPSVAGVESGGTVFALPPGWPTTVLEIVQKWRELEPELRNLRPETLEPVQDAVLIAPLTYPSKVVCAGANYYDHAEEMGAERPDPSAPPYFFLKPPTTTIVGHGSDVEIPTDVDLRIDWEIELGVVIADRIRDIDEESALDHVAAYTVANDLSARGLFHRDDAVFPAFAWDWLSHKGLDGFCPLGPGIVPAWLVPDPGALRLQLRVNGAVKQDSTTANLVVGIARLIAAASRFVTLEPGDVILTGTPAGVGTPKNEFLAVGDRMEAEIDGLGLLANRLVAR